jgi:hypothetical protein
MEPPIGSGIVGLPGKTASVEAKNAGMIALFHRISHDFACNRPRYQVTFKGKAS